MRKMKHFLFGFALLLLLSSCEDVIKVNVKQKQVKLVVDAFVNNLPQRQVIHISHSIPYFNQPGSEPGVEGAHVGIFDLTTGDTATFADSGNGDYIFHPNALTGDTFTVGHQYLLVVEENTDTLISFSTMQPTAKIDSLHVKHEDGKTIGFKEGNYVELYANDLVGEGNTYWVKTFRNDSFRGDIVDLNLAYDMTQTPNKQDGGLFIWPIRYGGINDFGRPWKTGEKARIEIHSITLETYYYLNQIVSESLNGGLFATPPSNIPTNITNFNPKKTSALAGFFCMSAVSRKEIVMP